MASTATHLVSVVIPVYRGEQTLPTLIDELAPFTEESLTEAGHAFRVTEVLLVFDNGDDDSPRVLRELVARHSFVRAIWLSKNFGQHAATLAGIASSGGEWVVTMDEDGQHDPADIAGMMDAAMAQQVPVIYAQPRNPPPHGPFRNATSRGAKWVLSKLLAGPEAAHFQSFRLLLGPLARSVAAYAGHGVYLDVAIGWVAPRAGTAPVTLRSEGPRRSGYTLRKLISHFVRMVLTSGTRGLRIVSYFGLALAAFGLVTAAVIVVSSLLGEVGVAGWASTITVQLIGTGSILLVLGIIAEYVGVNVNMSMGKPSYLILEDPQRGPLGRSPRRP